MFLRRWLSLLVSEGVRREAQSPGTGSPLTAAGETKTFSRTQSTAKKETEGLWSVAFPLGSSGKRWDQQVPVSSQLWPGKWDDLEEVRSPQQSVVSPRTLQLARDHLILCLTLPLLTGAAPSWCPTTGEGLGGHTWPTDLTQAGGHSMQGTSPSWEPKTNQRWKLLKWQESLILYVCHREEQPEHQSPSNKQYFRHYEHAGELCWWKICSCY